MVGKAVFPSRACCRAKHDTDFTAQDSSPSSGPTLGSPHPTLPCHHETPFCLFHFCSAYSSPAPEKPVILPIPSFLLQPFPLSLSHVCTISCQSRQEASSSWAHQDLRVRTFSSRGDVITHRALCRGKEGKPMPAGVGRETGESPMRGFHRSPEESSHFASASPWGCNYSRR